METSDERDNPPGAVLPLAEPVGNGAAFRERAKISATFRTQGPMTCTLRRDLIRDRTDQFRHSANLLPTSAASCGTN